MQSRLQSSFDLLVCPTCRGHLQGGPASLCCPACTTAFPISSGIPDFVPSLPSSPGISQRFMEAALVASIYENIVRPLVTRTVSPIQYRDEEAFLNTWCVPTTGTIVDLACGTGRYTRWLAEHKAGQATVVGIDLSRSMLLRAKSLTDGTLQKPAFFARATAQALPIADGEAGAVNCFGALHLFPDPSGAIREVGRILHSQGTFTLLTAGRASGRTARFAQSLFGRVATLRFFEDDEIRAWLDAANLDLVDFTRAGGVILAAAKKG